MKDESFRNWLVKLSIQSAVVSTAIFAGVTWIANVNKAYATIQPPVIVAPNAPYCAYTGSCTRPTHDAYYRQYFEVSDGIVYLHKPAHRRVHSILFSGCCCERGK